MCAFEQSEKGTDFIMGNPRRQRGRFRNNYNNKTIKILIVSVSVLAIALIASIIFTFTYVRSLVKDNSSQEIASSNENQPEEENNNLEVFGPEYQENYKSNSSYDFIGPRNGNVTFNITALGDIICDKEQLDDGYDANSDSYNFSYLFEDVKYFTQTGGLTIANLDTSFNSSQRGYKEFADTMKNIGVDVMTTANEHSLDNGYEGLENTINTLNNADVSHLGTYTSQEEHDKVFTKYIKGIKIAFINYTYGSNKAVPGDKNYCVNIANKDLIASDIEKAKAESPDVIIACMHWGTENQSSVNDEQKDFSDFLFQNGVDIVLGNHPHCVEPMEKRTVTLADGTQKDCFVVYSLGSFVSANKDDGLRNSVILNLQLTKYTNGKLTIDSAKYTPIHMLKNKDAKSKAFKILDLENSTAMYETTTDLSLGKDNYDVLKKQLDSIVATIGPEF